MFIFSFNATKASKSPNVDFSAFWLLDLATWEDWEAFASFPPFLPVAFSLVGAGVDAVGLSSPSSKIRVWETTIFLDSLLNLNESEIKILYWRRKRKY